MTLNIFESQEALRGANQFVFATMDAITTAPPQDNHEVVHDRKELIWNTVSQTLSSVFLFGLVFGMSATVNCKDIRQQFRNRRALLAGLGMQFLFMPMTGFISVVAMTLLSSSSNKNNSNSSTLQDGETTTTMPGFSYAMGIILLVVTSSPGGSYSNWWCSLFNAELPLSVAMTTVSSLVSIAMLPINLFLYTYLTYQVALSSIFGHDSTGTTDDRNSNIMSLRLFPSRESQRDDDIFYLSSSSSSTSILQLLDFQALFISLSIVLVALASGLFLGSCHDTQAFHCWANRCGNMSGVCLIAFSIVLTTAVGSGHKNDNDGQDEQASIAASFWGSHWTFYVGVALPCVSVLLVSNLVTRCAHLSPPESVAIAIECCYQNTGIATSVAIAMFSSKSNNTSQEDVALMRAHAIAVPLWYGLVEAVTVGIYCIVAWKCGWTKAPANELFCVVISTTYASESNKEQVDEKEYDDPKNVHDDIAVDDIDLELKDQEQPPCMGGGDGSRDMTITAITMDDESMLQHRASLRRSIRQWRESWQLEAWNIALVEALSSAFSWSTTSSVASSSSSSIQSMNDND